MQYKAESIINLIQRICVAKTIFQAKLLFYTKCLSETFIGKAFFQIDSCFFLLRFAISMCIKFLIYVLIQSVGLSVRLKQTYIYKNIDTEGFLIYLYLFFAISEHFLKKSLLRLLTYDFFICMFHFFLFLCFLYMCCL